MFLQQARYFSIALRHLSPLAQNASRSASPEELGRSFIYFPLVGFVFGLSLMTFYYLVSKVLGEELVCLFVLLFMVLFFNKTQGQARIRFIDLMFQVDRHPDKELSIFLSRTEVLRVSALFFIFMLKFLALLHVGRGWILGILVLLPAFSCWSLVYLGHSLGVTSIAGSAPFTYLRFVKTREFFGATFFVTLAAVMFLEIKGLFLLMVVSLGTAIFERFFLMRNREDVDVTLGVVMEFNEVSVLITAIVMQKGFSLIPAAGVLL